ncbi:MAG: amidase domain-containing protein [Oscillibacter sp.]|nr:amidase domain-containing protein [Oscillibacter sp.]
MKRRMRILPLLFLSALLCATLAAAESRPAPLNCHEMAAMWFGSQDEAQLLGDDGAEAALSGYFAAREAAFRGDMRLLSADEGISAAVAANNDLRTQRVKEMEARLGFSVSDADVTAGIERENTVRNADGTMTMYVYEWTFYDYDDLSDGAGGLDVSGFGTWHILTVAERPDGSFEILADEYDESDLLGINTLSAEHQQELLDRASAEPDVPYAAEPDDAASLLAISYYADYNVDAAVAYSEQYWGGIPGKTYKEGGSEASNERYNPAYANFNPYGGDCANFTSQCIYAGGMPQVVTKPYSNDGWYYKTSNDRSATWTGATNLHHWMRDNRGHCVTASKSTVYKGSPVFYSATGYASAEAREQKTNIAFNHAVLCVGTNSAGTPIINSHNTNRWHAMWNYYSGSVDIDTVQLTSKSFGSFSGYVKAEADFYAYIVNPTLKRYVTSDGANKVESRAKTERAGQVWHFVRLDDGSYQILSALRNDTQKQPALAASDGGWASRTPVCTEDYSAKPGQQWYLYLSDADKGLYHLRPKCSDRVMDIVEASDKDGAELWIFSRQKTEEDLIAQLFQIDKTTWVELEDPALEVKMEGSEGANVTFSWTLVEGAASYVLRVMQGENEIRAVTVRRSLSFPMKLEPGDYQARLEAFSVNDRTSSRSETIPFTVLTSYAITYYPNGGEGDPIEQMKVEKVDATLSEELPVRAGYTFVSWNTQANATGDAYMPGDVYAVDEDLSLYAQWTLSEYVVTLDPNGGSLPEDKRAYPVTYTKAYGEHGEDGKMPVPEMKDNEFLGWYTELMEGELVTEETLVKTAEDHTLYAHWESSVARIYPSVAKNGSQHIVSTTLYRIPSGVLFACGYLNGQMAAVASKGATESQDMILDGDFDSILVMALDNTNGMRPLCESRLILRNNFLGR